MNPPTATQHRLPDIAFAIFMATAIAWAYYPTALGLYGIWNTDPNYSQGFLVPVLVAGLLWHFASSPPPLAPEPDMLGGVILLAGATGLRGVGAYYYVTPLDHLSVLVMLAGVYLALRGRRWLARVWPAIAILAFMFPLPASMGGTAIIGGLQMLATQASTVTLQTMGVVAYREGNVIILKGAELGIVEACSGLRMLMVFCTLAVVSAILMPVGLIRKVIIVLSAVPLAISCNVLRIVAAGIASESLGSQAGYFIFHDLAGWLMVPLAFVLLAVELTILSYLFRVAPTHSRTRTERPRRNAR